MKNNLTKKDLKVGTYVKLEITYLRNDKKDIIYGYIGQMLEQSCIYIFHKNMTHGRMHSSIDIPEDFFSFLISVEITDKKIVIPKNDSNYSFILEKSNKNIFTAAMNIEGIKRKNKNKSLSNTLSLMSEFLAPYDINHIQSDNISSDRRFTPDLYFADDDEEEEEEEEEPLINFEEYSRIHGINSLTN